MTHGVHTDVFKSKGKINDKKLIGNTRRKKMRQKIRRQMGEHVLQKLVMPLCFCVTSKDLRWSVTSKGRFLRGCVCEGGILLLTYI